MSSGSSLYIETNSIKGSTNERRASKLIEKRPIFFNTQIKTIKEAASPDDENHSAGIHKKKVLKASNIKNKDDCKLDFC